MATGTVKWFSGEKGYGFITPADGRARWVRKLGRGCRSRLPQGR
jgi:hypothetical protein